MWINRRYFHKPFLSDIYLEIPSTFLSWFIILLYIYIFLYIFFSELSLILLFKQAQSYSRLYFPSVELRQSRYSDEYTNKICSIGDVFYIHWIFSTRIFSDFHKNNIKSYGLGKLQIIIIVGQWQFVNKDSESSVMRLKEYNKIILKIYRWQW